MLVTDDLVDALYGDLVRASLSAAGFETNTFAFPNGEAQKTLSTLCEMLERFGAFRLSKSDIVVCLGGGVVGDVGGFAAATYARGIRFAQIPTTLMAAVDSSVGGKTAVNLSGAKNMAGLFAQPILVLCDTNVLRDLPAALVSDGAAEIIKYGVLEDPSLLRLASDGHLLDEIDSVVERCVQIKRDYVQSDEFDRGKRRLLNLGHTIGHAVEQASGYTIPHGHGVSIGLHAIARAAYAMGISRENNAPEISDALTACGLPVESPFGKSELLSAAHMDKKREGCELTLALPIGLGQCELKRIPVTELGDWIEAGGIK